MRKHSPTVTRSRPFSQARQNRAWLATWLQRRRRRRLAVATAPEAGRESFSLLGGLLGFWALDGDAGAIEPELAGSAVGGSLVCEYVDLATEVDSVAGPGLHLARSFSNTAALSFSSPDEAFAQLPLTLNFWAKFPVGFDAGSGSIPWAWNCREIWGPPFSAYHYAGAAYVTAKDLDAGGVAVGNLLTAFCDDAWHMWTVMLDEDWNLSVYIDGFLSGEFALLEEAYALPTGTLLEGEVMDSLTFGNSKFAGALNGTCGSGHAMAMIGIWNRLLTAGEVTQLFNGGDGLGFSEL